MLALDPPDGGATVGGVVAAGDSGPLRSRYGGVRDLVVGMTVALSDGTVAKAGGKVIKNVAGYDLAKLFAGSFGTLGAILEVAVRLHPLPPATADRRRAAPRDSAPCSPRAAAALTHAPLEHAGLDVRWAGGEGWACWPASAARRRGPQAEDAAGSCAARDSTAELVEDDDRALGRAARRRSVREPASPTPWCACPGCRPTCPRCWAADAHSARAGGPCRRSACRGCGCATRRGAEAVEDAPRAASPRRGAGRPAEVRERVDPWGARDAALVELMRRVKERFDPAGTCAPGVLM